MSRPITVFATREEMQRVEMARLLLKPRPLEVPDPGRPVKAYRSCLAGSAQSNGRTA